MTIPVTYNEFDKKYGVLRYNTPRTRRPITGVPADMLGWSFEGLPSPARELAIDWWREWSETHTPKGLILVGGTDTGKSGWLASAAGMLAEQGAGSISRWNLLTSPMPPGTGLYALPEDKRFAMGSFPPVYYTQWPAFKRRLLAAPTWDDDDSDRYAYAKLIDRIHSVCSVLMLDDFDGGHGQNERINDIISSLFLRVEAGWPLFLATRVPPDKWNDICGWWSDRMLNSRYFTRIPLSSL